MTESPETDETQSADEAAPQQSDERQVSEGGGAFSGTETDAGGADAVPDKTTGTAPRRASQDE